MASHSSVLAWRIPWTAEPGGLQSKGLQTKSWTQMIMHVCMRTHTHTQSRIKIWKNSSHKKGILFPKK